MELRITRFDQRDERRAFEKGTFELVSAGGMSIGTRKLRAGWRWSEHVGPVAGTELCEVEHVGIVVSGRAAVRMADGKEFVMESGDVFSIPAGHVSWVVGDEPYMSYHLMGASGYAARDAEG